MSSRLPLDPVAAPAAFRPPGVARRSSSRQVWTVLGLFAGAVTAYQLMRLRLSGPEQLVALPAFALILLTVVMVVVLWRRDRQLPVFELGAVCCVATAVYSAVPLLGFLLSGLEWTYISDNRLFVYSPSPAQVGAFAWRHVLYLACFVAAYLVVRGRTVVRSGPLRYPERPTRMAIMVLGAGLMLYFWVLNLAFGASYNVSYSSTSGTGIEQLPYVVQQISHNLDRISLILKGALLALLLRNWRSPVWRGVLFAWLGVEVVMMLGTMGARTRTAIFVLSLVLLYHRLIRPLNARVAAFLGVAMLAGVLVYGVRRDLGGQPLGAVPLWSASNEFQSLWATSYDLHVRSEGGVLGTVPWQVYASDLLLLVPSQLLPVQKWDPSVWYLEVAGLRGSGFGAMFGVVSQAVVGLDWLELILRGGVLGVVFGMIHRWYARRAASFWATMLYLTLCIWAYYTYRATSFYFIYFVLYSFVPTVLLVRLGAALLRGGRLRVPSPRAGTA